MISKNIINARTGVLYQSLGELGAILNQAFPMLGEELQKWVQQTNERMQQVDQQDVLDRLMGSGPNGELLASLNRATSAVNGERLVPLSHEKAWVPEPVEQEVDWQAVSALIGNTFDAYMVDQEGDAARKWDIPDRLFSVRNEQGEIQPVWLNELDQYDLLQHVLAFNEIGEEELASQFQSDGRILLINVSRPSCKQWLLVAERAAVRFMLFTYVPVEETWVAHQVGHFLSIDDVRTSLINALGDAAVEITLGQAEERVRELANRNLFGSTGVRFLKEAAVEAEVDLIGSRSTQIGWPLLSSIPYVVLTTSDADDGWVEKVTITSTSRMEDDSASETPAPTREDEVKLWDQIPFRVRHDLIMGLARMFHAARLEKEKALVKPTANDTMDPPASAD